MRNAILASVGVHAVVAAAIVAGQILVRPLPPPPPPFAQVELVQQDTPTVGSSRPVPPLPPAAAPEDATREPQAEKTPDAPPAKPKPPDALAPPLPPPPAKPVATPSPSKQAVQPAPPPPPPAPPVRLDAEGDPGTGLVTGEGVIPAKPEDAINTPPAYPKDAARRGEEGLVSLLIRVDPNGSAEAVDVVTSSGYPRLDEAARKAVMAWHFRPAEQDGERVASVLRFNVHYLLPKPGDPLWSGSTE